MSNVPLEEAEARRLLTAQRDELEAQLAARRAVDLLQLKVQETSDATKAIFQTLATKYGLDPAVTYELDGLAGALVPRPKADAP